MTASRPTDNLKKRRSSNVVRALPQNRQDRARVIGIVVASIIVCSLIAGGVLPVILDRMNQSAGVAPPTAVIEGPSEFERQLRAEIERQPDNPQLMVSLANLLVAEGRSDEAIDWYERAIAVDPERIETRLDFGAALARRGSFSDAELQYHEAIAIDEGNADAHYLLGELYLAWQPPRTEEAIVAFERAVAAQPESVAAARAREALAEIQNGDGTPAATPAGSAADSSTEEGP